MLVSGGASRGDRSVEFESRLEAVVASAFTFGAARRNLRKCSDGDNSAHAVLDSGATVISSGLGRSARRNRG
jgi:hypothetical protein